MGALRPPRPITTSNHETGQRRFAAEQELKAQLKSSDDEHIRNLRELATKGYEEEDARDARISQRSQLVLGGVSVIATLTLAGAGWLIGKDAIPTLAGKLAVGGWALLTAAAFALAALYAHHVSMPDTFSRPYAPGSLVEQLGKDPSAIGVDEVAALLEAGRWNQSVVDCRNRRLQRARMCYRAALLMLVVLGVLVVVLSVAS